MRTALTTLVAAAALAAPAAAPAATSAADLQITQIAQAQNIGDASSVSRTHMSFECVAAAPAASTVRIDECFIEGIVSGARYDAHIGTPAPGTAVAADVRNVALEPYRVCVRSSATGLDGSTASAGLHCQ